MPDDPTDTQASRGPSGKPDGGGLADTPQDAATGAARPQVGPTDRPGTEAGDAADEPMTGEPVAVSGDDPGVGMTEEPEPDIEGTRGM